MLKARTALDHLAPYDPPLSGRCGLRLDFNESTIGCSPRVLECLRGLRADKLARYPEREPVEHEVAAFLGLDPNQVLLTNGVDEAIHLVCEAYLDADLEALVVVPTFGMYRVYAAATGARVVSVPAAERFRFPAEELQRQITQKTRLIAIANPNNPTGVVAQQADLLQILSAASHAAVLIDEAYFEFHGETLVDKIGLSPNLFVARTFSKAYGLAGLRIGVLAGDTRQLAVLRRAVSPYNVNAVALACLTEALRDQEYVRWYVQQVRRARRALEAELQDLGFDYCPSQANFVLVRAGALHAKLLEATRARGILVRDRSADPGCAGCVRITVGTPEQMTAVTAVLREVSDRQSTVPEATA